MLSTKILYINYPAGLTGLYMTMYIIFIMIGDNKVHFIVKFNG